MPARELVRVRGRRLAKARDGAVAEEEAEHARDGPARDGVARGLALPEDALDEALRERRELLVLARPLQDLERFDAGRHRERVARERARLVHRARGRDLLHDVAAPAVRADGQAAADDLAHRRHVGRHAEVLLRAAVVDAEARHDLVEDQQRAVLRRERAEALEELLRRRDEARVAHDGLEHDGGALVRLEELLDGGEVVVLRDERARRRAGRHARRVGQTERRDARARLDEEAVRVAVVAALELDDLLAARVRADEAEHAHARLRARVREADHLHGGDRVDDHFGEDVLVRRRRAERRALLERLAERVVDLVVRVAADGRAPGADVVDVLVVVDVVRVRALDAVEDNGRTSNRIKRANRRRHAAGHERLGLRHDRVGLRRDVLHRRRRHGHGRAQRADRSGRDR
mmetsp:Transcript_27728/g.85715  ORF Transcript_27728/g.85715 Transcript_27728/m.85715 type:complete len:405 (-) Transcript_27728:166-1380(-)